MQFSYSFGNGVSIRFPNKPPDNIRAMLKSAGFRWGNGEWCRRRVAGAADFLAALERACNPGKPDGNCWRCKSPDGFFRPQGPATPVYCNECWTTLQENLARAVNGLPVPRLAPDRSDLDYEDACARACDL
jgi:hypothetical protein